MTFTTTVGQTITLKVVTTPENATATFSYALDSNAAILAVSADTMSVEITGLTVGSANLTGTASTGETKTVAIAVEAAVVALTDFDIVAA